MKLASLVADYLVYKRALGHRYVSEGFILRAFCRHLGDVAVTAVSTDSALAFIRGQGVTSQTAAGKHSVLAGLYRYALARQLCAGSPLPPALPQKPSSFIPYIYTHEELKRLLDAAIMTCTARAFIADDVLRTLLLVLYGAGLRLGEALALNETDVDLEQALLTIRHTKFYKSRFVPIGVDLVQVLHDYRHRHDGRYTLAPHVPFFCFRNGQRVSASALERTFRRLRTAARVRRPGGARHQPRLHDLRHTSAVHRLIQWYQSGADLQRLLPHLAVYLGHVDLSSTQHYLTLTPQLLRQASLRFEHYAMENDHA